MRLRRLSLLSTVALGLAIVPALAQQPKKILRVVPSADVAELDPTRAANQIGRIYAQMVFELSIRPRPCVVAEADDGG